MTQEHATPEAPQVTVRGEGRLEVDPELARIWVAVSARGPDRSATLADLTRRNALVLDLVKAQGSAVEKLETGSFSISPELTRKGRGERVHAFHGRVRVTAELTDFTVLGELVTRLADLELTSVDGPWWSLRPASPSYAEARRLAVTEAVARARAYAEALGTSLDSLLELSDAGDADPLRPRRAVFGSAAVAYSAEGVADAPPLDLEPQRQTVTAEVVARFTMRPPAL
ncbi:SIMPL domain-containing protein [Streptomyces sp. NBC_00572]|uniref:SIMPL domain-containing protein n=1 Tax=Streptomyces sp. NBC_00572 TaxID=2903664 RepID=UPI002256567B|nr:SIMPL domain-containing protein [Streptomyces sp. NBC_00572]MCX4980253.1 SIMPL domain-containing protein [Streptomyces sp. NBC_00572]